MKRYEDEIDLAFIDDKLHAVSSVHFPFLHKENNPKPSMIIA